MSQINEAVARLQKLSGILVEAPINRPGLPTPQEAAQNRNASWAPEAPAPRGQGTAPTDDDDNTPPGTQWYLIIDFEDHAQVHKIQGTGAAKLMNQGGWDEAPGPNVWQKGDKILMIATPEEAESTLAQSFGDFVETPGIEF